MTNPSLRMSSSRRLLPLALSLAIGAAIGQAQAAQVDIPPQPLDAALRQLGQQTSLQLFFTPELVQGKQAPAVSGELAPEQALERLLQGSGLDYQVVGNGVVLRKREAGADAPLQMESSEVKVVGDWLADAQERDVQNHPGARTVVRRQAMEERGVVSVREALRGIPGVQVQENNGTGGSDISLNVGVRGLTSRLSPRSTILIDGVPAAVAPYGQPQLSMFPGVAGSYDSIDVVRGAGSVRYGPQNVGGVINFVTRAIPETFSGEVGTTVEHAGHGGWKQMQNAFIGGTADNGIGMALLYSGVKGDGYRDSNNHNDIDDVTLKTHWAPTDSDDLALNLHYYDGTADMPGGLTQAQFDHDPYQSVRDWDSFRGRRSDGSLKWTRKIDDLTQLEVLTYYSDSFRGSDIANRDLKTLASYPRDYHTFGFEPRLSRIFFVGPTTQEASVGYRYLKEDMEERASQVGLVNNVPTPQPGADGHVYQDRTGGTEANSLYIDDKIDVGNWTVTPGIRFERISTDWQDRPVLDNKGKPVQAKSRSKDYNEPLPALSVMYHVSDAWKLFANYETSFGSLQYFQLGQGGRGNQTADGLEPEKARTYEVGTRYDDGAFGGEVTLFYIDFDDELQYISNDVGWTNLGATKHQGIETSAHYDLAALDPRLEGLTAYGTLTYTRATYEGDIPGFKGRDLPFYSRQVATVGMRYVRDRWTYNLDAFAQSKQRAPGPTTDANGNFTHNYITDPTADGQYGDIPGYALWNARVGYDFGPQLSNLKLGAGVKNLFDKVSYTRSSDNNSGIYVGQPRTFFVQASVGF